MRRVVVTGMGTVNPIGLNVDEYWEGLKAGKTGFGEITYFDTTDFKVKVAAEVKGFVAADRMDKKAARRMEPFAQYAVAAAKEAFEDAGLDMEKKIRIVLAVPLVPVSEVYSLSSVSIRNFWRKDRPELIRYLFH